MIPRVNIEVYQYLLPDLKAALDWIKSPLGNEMVDMESVFEELFAQYPVTLSEGFLNPIYVLSDGLVDSVTHNMDYVNDLYTIDAGIRDLETIIRLIEEGNSIELENDFKMRRRILGPYNPAKRWVL